MTYWPKDARDRGRPPLRLRPIRVRSRRGARRGPRAADVWLLTDVLCPERLSVEQAARFYRLRWENEGLFRTDERTLAKVHLTGRTVRTVHREAYGALLACQRLLAQGTWALYRPRSGGVAACSARHVLRVVRRELIAAMRVDRRTSYRGHLERCPRERRERSSAKEKRRWPRRTPHKPPRWRTMSEEEKAWFASYQAAG